MKLKLFLLTLLLTLAFAIPIPSPIPALAEAGMYNTDPMKFTVDLKEGSGSTVLKLTLGNSSSSEYRSFIISNWFDYTYVSSGELPMPKEWVTNIVPAAITLPPAGETRINIELTVPPGTVEGKYKTWLKVSDTPHTEDRPITVVVRLGTYVPTFEYSMNPSFYSMTVGGEGDAEETVQLFIRNSGFAPCAYRLYVPKAVSSNGEPWRDGITYQPITELEQADTYEELCNIIRVSGAKTIGPYEIQPLSFGLFVPADIPNGYYEARVGAQIAPGEYDAAIGMAIQYECRLLITVDRALPPTPSKNSNLPFYIGAGLAALLLFAILLFLAYHTGKRRSPYSTQPPEPIAPIPYKQNSPRTRKK